MSTATIMQDLRGASRVRDAIITPTGCVTVETQPNCVIDINHSVK